MNQIQLNKQDFIFEQLNEAIEKNKISKFNVHTYNKKRSNIYIQKDYKVESILNSNRDEIQIKIFKEFDNGIGENSFSVSNAISKEDFTKELEDAIFICSQSKSKKYNLKTNTDEIEDDEIDYHSYYSKRFIDDFNSKNLNLLVFEKVELLKFLISKNSNEKIQIVFI